MKDSTVSPQPTQRSSDWTFLALLALILLAFALRVYRLPAQSLWYDEGVSWYMTRLSLPDLTVWTADDIQPPLYYYLLWLWTRLAGTGEYALRFPSVFFGTLTVPLIWVTGQRLMGRRAAWLAALFLALSPLHVYYAQEARMYTLLTFLGLLSSYLFLKMFPTSAKNHSQGSSEPRRRILRPFASLRVTWRGPTSGSTKLAWAYILTIAAALYTHYFAFFLLAAHVLYLFWQWWRQVRSGHTPQPRVSSSALAFMAIFILYLPWLPFLLTRYGVDTSYWQGDLNLGEIARRLFIAFSLGETVKEGIAHWLGIGYAAILLISLVALIWSNGRGTGNEPADPSAANSNLSSRFTHYPRPHLVFLLLYLLIPVALVLLLVLRTPKFNPRYAMLASPAFILLIAGGLASLIGERGAGSEERASSGSVLAPEGGVGTNATLYAFPKGPWKGEARFTFHVSRFTLHVSRFTFHVSSLPPPSSSFLPPPSTRCATGSYPIRPTSSIRPTFALPPRLFASESARMRQSCSVRGTCSPHGPITMDGKAGIACRISRFWT